MSYPTFLLATLDSVNGNSCGGLNARLEKQNTTPITYNKVSGNFATCTCTRIDLGGGVYTWEVEVRQMGGACNGKFNLRRSPAADDPTGTFCKLLSDGTTDCSAVQMTIDDDD